MPGWITDRPLDTAALLQRVCGPAAGAAVLFMGTVRDHNQGAAVTGIRYEAYAEMAGAVLEEIAAEAEARFDARVAAVHRVGELVVGEASVAIAAAAAHRAQAYDASRYVIEEIKVRLPVWKEERYANGTSRWLDGAAPAGQARC
jgi:molybdopterin synthase catalytic subunit